MPDGCWRLGVDPGGSHTGAVLVTSEGLISHQLLHRPLDTTVEGYALMLARVIPEWAASVAGPPVAGIHEARVETVVPPRVYIRGKKQALNPTNLIAVSMVAGTLAGALEQAGWAVKWVRPARHGATPDLPSGAALDAYMAANYPFALLPAKPGGKYTDQKRHLRSAWDIAQAPCSNA